MNTGIIVAIVAGVIILIIGIMMFGRKVQNVETHFHTYKLDKLADQSKVPGTPNAYTSVYRLTDYSDSSNPLKEEALVGSKEKFYAFKLSTFNFAIQLVKEASEPTYNLVTKGVTATLKYKLNNVEYTMKFSVTDVAKEVPAFRTIQIQPVDFTEKNVATYAYVSNNEVYSRFLK